MPTRQDGVENRDKVYIACENSRFSSLFNSPLGTFPAEERLQLSGRRSILMTYINVYIIIVMGIQMQICSILRFSWSILAKCYALRTSSSKTQMLLLERLYFSNTDCFVRDSSRLHLTFAAFCLSSVIRKQYLKQCNYSVDQSALLTGFRTDFTTSVLNICR